MQTKVKLILTVVVVVVIAGAGLLTLILSSATSRGSSDTSSNAKINITAVCKGALAYMSFPSGAEAEVFVEECKEGKHPEVIEKYKADMNLGAAI